ncbi:SGNH/GDSL hydrolase family protein [Sporobolomyces salmoneus]|uniref:SGNH/GDSL hydrolase family protein n=1 Tax=Sporobolomyces salmoneus TaxID=183962 RepID=UPI00317C45DC
MSTGKKQNDRFLLLGDSITEWSFGNDGLGAQLSHLYHRRLDVVNRGLAGYNSRWALECFKQWLPPSPAKDDPHTVLATLWLGANDCVLPHNKQHVPLSEFRQNLLSITQLLTSPSSPHYDPSTQFVLITPTPISPPDWVVERKRRGMKGEMDRVNENTRKYVDTVIELGRELKVPVVDAFEAIWEAAEKETKEKEEEFEKVLSTFYWDGLHLSAKGYKQVVDQVKRVIKETYPEKHWESLPMLFPDWKTIPDEDQASVQQQLDFILSTSSQKPL